MTYDTETDRTAKADPLLQDALQQATEDEKLRVLVSLRPESTRASKADVPSPDQFDDRVSYRQAIIQHQQTQQGQSLEKAIGELRSLSLDVQGGAISPVVVVTGAAKDIARALDLPDVAHASLDREINVEQPKKQSKKSSGKSKKKAKPQSQRVTK
jgi:hypothetical protein